MRRRSLLCLWFLAVPLAARQPAPSPFRPGEVSLEISDSAFSALALSVPALGASLCTGVSPLPRKISGQGKCHPPPPGKAQVLRLGIVETLPTGGGATVVRLFPRTLRLAGTQPFNTACGTWRYSLTLDPRVTQRISKAVLRPDASDVLSGEVQGVLPMAAVLHFETVDEGRRVDMPLTLHLDLAGHWTALPLPLAGGILDPAASNLVLFAEPPGKPGGRWTSRRDCTGLSPFVGEVCLSASPSMLKSLNVSPEEARQ
jgi:hypothetical protein